MPIQKLRPTFTFDQDRLDQLRAIVPEAFADGKINWDVLRETLGEHLEPEDDDVEHFGLFWPGKREARHLASRPSQGALIPQPGLGVDEATTRNLFIEGDNLEVLKLLQRSYAGRIKMIYIDPPYNTGNDFIYSDDFAEPLESYLQRTGQADEAGQILTSNTRASGRFHSNWLSMMYPRLRLARQLLCDDGVIFVSIDDNEQHHLRTLMDEIFGQENWLGTFVWKSRQMVDNRTKTGISIDHEYILCYGKSSAAALRGSEKDLAKFSNPDNDPRGPWRSADLTGLATKDRRPNLHYDLKDPSTGIIYPCPPKGWRFEPDTMQKKIQEGRVLFPASGQGRPRHKLFLEEMASIYTGLSTISTDLHTTHGTKDMLDLFGESVIQFPKPVELIKRLIQQVTDDGDIVLDFFAGSGTTAQAMLELNRMDNARRHFVLVQIPEKTPKNSPAQKFELETIADIGRERIRRVIAQMQAETQGQLDLRPDEDLGFKCYRLDRTHFKQWRDYQGDDPDQVATLFDRFESPLVEGWQPGDLLTEILLIEGFPLDSRVEPQDRFTHNQVRLVTSDFHAHRLFVCLDPTVAPDTIAQLDLQDQDIFVCLDTALTDEAKIRLSDTGNIHVI